jgi:hypothetical protein
MASPISIILTPTTESVSVHHVPCRLRYDGPAKVSTYFTPSRPAGGGPSVAHFRGRELVGHVSALPAGVSGVVFRELVGAELAVAKAGTCAASAPPSGGGAAPAPPPAALTAAQRLALLDEEEEGGGGGFDGGFFGEDMDGSGSESGGGGGGGGGGDGGGAGAPGGGPAASAPTRVWAVDGRFDSLTSWLHDAPATEHDLLPRAVSWMKTAQQLHAE